MKLNRFVVSGALFTVALGGFSLTATAQSYKATFTLPYEARWANVVLQPGDYTLTNTSVGSTPLISVAGNGKTASVFAGPYQILEPSERGGKLELTEVNGTYVVTRFLASAAGRDYSFAIPKSVSRGGFGAVALKKTVVPVSN